MSSVSVLRVGTRIIAVSVVGEGTNTVSVSLDSICRALTVSFDIDTTQSVTTVVTPGLVIVVTLGGTLQVSVTAGGTFVKMDPDTETTVVGTNKVVGFPFIVVNIVSMNVVGTISLFVNVVGRSIVVFVPSTEVTIVFVTVTGTFLSCVIVVGTKSVALTVITNVSILLAPLSSVCTLVTVVGVSLVIVT